ncbi:hypothetical protein V1T75_05530 [Tenacibaculum sp. FZY0031]|uniref:hypothetical protein n=1 Tax=Tenacibaculum sp. FZY0031 TaxID=3116648 RepID=UPI002EA5F523|nr:hypothetical protein [Tenacibaculum sp. FZY0031]
MEKIEIKEGSITRVISRTVGLVIISYLVFNFYDNPSIYGICIFIISFQLLVNDEAYTITADSRGIEVSHSNLLKISASKQYIRYSEISDIRFTHNKFSLTIFLLNAIIRSAAKSHKDSLLTIYKKNGDLIEMKGVGTKGEVEYLRKLLSINLTQQQS